MASKKGAGSSRNGRDSQSQRLGVKKFGGELVTGGSIILRQRGTKINAGENVGVGKDHTLYARVPGIVEFRDRGRMGKFVMIRTVPIVKTPMAATPIASAPEVKATVVQ